MNIPKDMLPGTTHKTKSYGDIVIIKYTRSRQVLVEFIDTKYQTETQSEYIRNGSIKDKMKPSVCGVGFIGDGPYTSRVNKVKTLAYETWRGIIRRCYDISVREKNPTYEGCTVCDEWHNFQNFAKWFNDNHMDGLHVDKDIKINGNKVYSPDACMFVTQSDNNNKAHAKTYLFISPVGREIEIHNLAEFCAVNDLSRACMSDVYHGRQSSHNGWTANNHATP